MTKSNKSKKEYSYTVLLFAFIRDVKPCADKYKPIPDVIEDRTFIGKLRTLFLLL